MSSTTEYSARTRLFILIMALCFISMLGISLWQRFSHPDLVIHRFDRSAQMREMPAAMPDNMSAIGQMMQQVAQNPQDLETTIKLVETLMSLGQWQSAENFAQKALALTENKPKETRPLYLLGIIHHNRGQHAQAAELLEKTLEKAENPSARYSLGILYLHFLNNREKGIAQLRKGLSLPDVSPSLRAAMQEELDKLNIQDRRPIPAENTPAASGTAMGQ